MLYVGILKTVANRKDSSKTKFTIYDLLWNGGLNHFQKKIITQRKTRQSSMWELQLRREKFSSDQQISSFLSKIFGNKICQTWSKPLENDGLRKLYWGVSSFLMSKHFHLFLTQTLIMQYLKTHRPLSCTLTLFYDLPV
jgi:hypothetical protein